MSEGRRINKGKGLFESDTHRPVFGLGVKPPIITQMLCGRTLLQRADSLTSGEEDKTKEVLYNSPSFKIDHITPSVNKCNIA